MFPVDAFQNTLRKASECFDRLEIRFHLTGGITSILYGEPRMTQDIDLVIDPVATARQVAELISSIQEAGFVCDEKSIHLAIETAGMFQLFDRTELLKLDIYPRELIPGELDRSEQCEVFQNVIYPIASRQDTILSKLIWISKGSHKSRRDLRQLWRNSSSNEKTFVRKYAQQVQQEALLDQVLMEQDELE